MAFGVWAMNVGFFIQGKSGLLPSIAEYMGSRNCCLATDGVGVLVSDQFQLLYILSLIVSHSSTKTGLYWRITIPSVLFTPP